MFKATLIGELDGYVVVREFSDRSAAVRWACGEGLKDFEDQTARGVVVEGHVTVWERSHLQTAEQRQRNEQRDATRFLASLNLTDKGRR